MTCTSGKKGAAYAATPLTRATGGGSFEFLFVSGTSGDEALAFGCASKKPMDSVEYDSGKFWVVRAWNGQLYGPSKASRTASKLHPTNSIRFSWDAAGSGDVTMYVNGALDGVVFTNIRDAEIYPVVRTPSRCCSV